MLTLCYAAVLLSAAPARALETGELKELEGLLRDLGFDPGPVDGVVDTDTTEAIRRYKEFALAPGAPEPSAALLDELRGVAAAFAALNAGKAAAPPPAGPTPAPLPDLGTGPEEMPVPEPVAEKVVVPPPPAPPKLKPQEEAAEETVAEIPPVAALPPTEDATPEEEAEPADKTPALIDAELAPHRADLDSGAVTPQALAKQFNAEGRKLLQAAQYDAAILKFTVAIQLDPDFAGAYSNRGTAYQRQEQQDLATADFDKAKELGFGGLRLRDGTNPLN
ncbi:MAG: tetratricopeptide repeat protein [Kiloniellaceae bacterium]